MKSHSPLLGFNTNVRHKGKVFHIQTEDSGIKHPHIITHLFADGGRILKSTKTSYAEHLGDNDLTEKVRTMMKDQHKAMFMALRDGSFDTVIDDPSTNTGEAQAIAKPVVTPNPNPNPSVSRAPESVAADPLAAQAWSGAPSSPPEAPVFQPQPDLPPPPATAAVAKKPGVGSYSVNEPGHSDNVGNARYVASRPAAIFAAARPSDTGNVFGEEMISDKSLDEVILSFLAEEFGTNSGKAKGEGNR